MAEQKFFPLLPKLKEISDKQTGNFPSAGVWSSRGAIELDNLSECLDVGKIDPKYFDIDCIPDMWARPLLFEMALYDTNHLLHTRILEEWRGLLAMLALKEWHVSNLGDRRKNSTRSFTLTGMLPLDSSFIATSAYPFRSWMSFMART